MMNYSLSKAILVGLVLCIPAIAQDSILVPTPAPAQDTVEVRQVTYLDADSAELLTTDEGAKIVAEGLKPGSKSGALVSIGGSYEKIEVRILKRIDGIDFASWKTVDVAKYGSMYLLEGKPGQRFGVWIFQGESKQELVVELEGELEPPESPEDPPTNLTEADKQALRAIAQDAIRTLGDNVTASMIADSLSNLTLSGSIDVATERLKQAVADALVASMARVDPPYKDWYGQFRVPLNSKIVELSSEGKVTSGEDLQAIVNAVVGGMGVATEKAISSYVKVHTRADCVVCKSWFKSVAPELESKGWVIVEVVDESSPVPWFEVHTNGKTDKFHGFMSVADFAQLVSGLR